MDWLDKMCLQHRKTKGVASTFKQISLKSDIDIRKYFQNDVFEISLSIVQYVCQHINNKIHDSFPEKRNLSFRDFHEWQNLVY